VDEPETIWPQLQTAMIDVIEHGTARRAQIPGITWAGKTGSTEHSGPNKKTHSWFVGYAPVDNPRIAIAVLVEESGHGGEIAAPIAAAIVKRYMEEVGALPKESNVDLKSTTALSAH
jgi:cell division protein FtsI/penicillin-binding protein 2